MKSKSDIIRRDFITRGELRLREKDNPEDRMITGYAIMFGVPSVPLWDDEEEEVREEIAPEAVTRGLLDGSDIKMTMFHDRQLILARSNGGSGTLSYDIDDKGVSFEFYAPRTADGDKALELVRRGDISGCSFAFSTRYYDKEFVERSVSFEGGKKHVLCVVRRICGVYDFTLAADPAYPDTSCALRELAAGLDEERESCSEQLRAMRRAAGARLFR